MGRHAILTTVRSFGVGHARTVKMRRFTYKKGVSTREQAKRSWWDCYIDDVPLIAVKAVTHLAV